MSKRSKITHNNPYKTLKYVNTYYDSLTTVRACTCYKMISNGIDD